MRLTRVSTGTGETVSLEFAADLVEVRALSPGRQRAARITGGSLVVAFGLAAVAGNAEDRGVHLLGTVMWVMTGVLVLVGVVGAGSWWLGSVLRQRGRDRMVITASSVTAAHSAMHDAEVCVSVSTDDGAQRSFSASGHAGAVLATEFGRLLQITAPALQVPQGQQPPDQQPPVPASEQPHDQ